MELIQLLMAQAKESDMGYVKGVARTSYKSYECV